MCDNKNLFFIMLLATAIQGSLINECRDAWYYIKFISVMRLKMSSIRKDHSINNFSPLDLIYNRSCSTNSVLDLMGLSIVNFIEF